MRRDLLNALATFALAASLPFILGPAAWPQKAAACVAFAVAASWLAERRPA